MNNDRLKQLAGVPLTEGRAVVDDISLIVQQIYDKAEAAATNEAAETGSAVNGDRIMEHAEYFINTIRSSIDQKIRADMI